MQKAPKLLSRKNLKALSVLIKHYIQIKEIKTI